MTYAWTVTLKLEDVETIADVHDGHAYLKSVTWHGVDILPAILTQPDLLRELEEAVWHRWYSDQEGGKL